MSLKMKLAAAAMAIGASTANGQSFDYAKESKVNPVGAEAVLCQGAAQAVLVIGKPSEPRYSQVQALATRSTSAAQKSYPNPQEFSSKILGAGLNFSRSAGVAKSKGEYFFAIEMTDLEGIVKSCEKTFPAEAKPQ